MLRSIYKMVFVGILLSSGLGSLTLIADPSFDPPPPGWNTICEYLNWQLDNRLSTRGILMNFDRPAQMVVVQSALNDVNANSQGYQYHLQKYNQAVMAVNQCEMSWYCTEATLAELKAEAARQLTARDIWLPLYEASLLKAQTESAKLTQIDARIASLTAEINSLQAQRLQNNCSI